MRNLITHDSGNTWKTICSALKNAGYRLPEKPLLLSPHQFGIPQFRERVLIPGIYDPGNVGKPLRFVFPGLMKKEENSIYSVAGHPGEAPGRKISEKEKRILEIWDGFYRGLDIKTIGFPVWSEYFTTESPPEGIPAWKTDIIRKNRALYLRNRGFIDKWLAKHDFLRSFNPSYRKFEWQCGERIGSVFEGVIQFRPSGVRVKTPDVFPALVAMVQVPVLGRSGRRISVREAARLQSFPEDFLPHPVESEAFRQLGNSVSVKVIRAAAEELFRNSSGFKEREEDRSETGREELAHVRRR